MVPRVWATLGSIIFRRWPRSGAILEAVMLHTLRRIIGGEVRPVDLWLTIIEILVLLLIALEVAWAMKDRLVAWRKLKAYRQGIMARLDSLSLLRRMP